MTVLRCPLLLLTLVVLGVAGQELQGASLDGGLSDVFLGLKLGCGFGDDPRGAALPVMPIGVPAVSRLITAT